MARQSNRPVGGFDGRPLRLAPDRVESLLESRETVRKRRERDTDDGREDAEKRIYRID